MKGPDARLKIMTNGAKDIRFLKVLAGGFSRHLRYWHAYSFIVNKNPRAPRGPRVASSYTSKRESVPGVVAKLDHLCCPITPLTTTSRADVESVDSSDIRALIVIPKGQSGSGRFW